MAIPLGSGMGAYGAGVGPCGHDPEDALVASLTQTPVAALYFDPLSRTYVQNADFTMVAGTGPIQRAAHLLMPLGSIPAVPLSGFDTGAVKRAAPDARKAVIEDALRRTWKVLLDTQQISFGNVVLTNAYGVPWTGGPWDGFFFVPVYDLINRAKTPIPLTGRVA